MSSVIQQPDGKLVNSLDEFVIVRFLPDGTLDPQFGVGGRNEAPAPARIFVPPKLVLQPDDGSGGMLQFRLLPDGTLDRGFGNSGIVTTDSPATLFSVALQPDGRLLALGELEFGPFTRFALLRFNLDGTLDSSIGNEEQNRCFSRNESVVHERLDLQRIYLALVDDAADRAAVAASL